METKQELLKIIDELQDCGAMEDGGLVIKSCSNKQLAEALIANNVIKLPAKIGSKVYAIMTPCGGCENAEFTEDGLKECKNCDKYTIEEIEFAVDLTESWGEYVFATFDEAQCAVKEKEKKE